MRALQTTSFRRSALTTTSFRPTSSFPTTLSWVSFLVNNFFFNNSFARKKIEKKDELSKTVLELELAEPLANESCSLGPYDHLEQKLWQIQLQELSFQKNNQEQQNQLSTTVPDRKETDVKEEIEDSDITGQVPDASQEEGRDAANAQPFDSEDSLSQEHVASELRRLEELRVSATLAGMRMRAANDQPQSSEGGAVAPGAEEAVNLAYARNTQGAVAPESGWTWEDIVKLTHLRDQEDTEVECCLQIHICSIPSIWIRHDHEESVRVHEDPMDRLHERMSVMEHNLDTLRTRVTQVADLRDAQGIREDHRAIIARLNEVEECATVHTLREFMPKIRRLESMFTGEDGGAILHELKTFGHVTEDWIIIGMLWMTSMLESAHRIGIMIFPNRKEVKKRRTNLVLKIGHQEDAGQEDMHHNVG